MFDYILKDLGCLMESKLKGKGNSRNKEANQKAFEVVKMKTDGGVALDYTD